MTYNKLLRILLTTIAVAFFLSSGLNRYDGLIGQVSQIVWYVSGIGFVLLLIYHAYQKRELNRFQKVITILKIIVAFILIISTATTLSLGFDNSSTIWFFASSILSGLALFILLIFDLNPESNSRNTD